MKYPPYPKYRKSGVEWLGDVPEHWEALETRFAYALQLGRMLQPEPDSADDIEVPYLKALHVQWERVESSDLPTMWSSRRDVHKYAVTQGDLLVCEGGEVGRAGILAEVGPNTIIQNALHRVRPKNGNDLRFLMYSIRVAASQNWFELLCNRSTIAHFTGEKFGALKIGLPSPAEQRAIADFLDAQTAKIDTLVGKKRELVERLKEKRTALISRTVTRGLPPDAARAAGLDPNPPLKPSDIEWLGDIPEHWGVKPLRYPVDMQSGATPDKSKPEYWDGHVPWVSPKDMKKPLILDSADHISEAAIEASSLALLPPNSVLIVVRGMILAHSFPVAMCGIPLTINQDMKCLQAYHRLMPWYLLWTLTGLSHVLVSLTGESAHGTRLLETDTLRKFLFPLPPDKEQVAIADYLDHETGKIDRMVEKVEAAIEKLREYRTALITAAVTGKIDVREVEV